MKSGPEGSCGRRSVSQIRKFGVGGLRKGRVCAYFVREIGEGAAGFGGFRDMRWDWWRRGCWLCPLRLCTVY